MFVSGQEVNSYVKESNKTAIVDLYFKNDSSSSKLFVNDIFTVNGN